MYIPKAFEIVDKDKIYDFIRSNSFGILFSQEENTVPTWNYIAVHVYGEVRLIEDRDEMVELMEELVTFYEESMPIPWDIPRESKFMDGLMSGIVGIEITIKKIEGKWKLNQNHSIKRQQNLINGLRTSNKYNSREIANIMEENIKANT